MLIHQGYILTIICADPSPISLFRLERSIRKILPAPSVHLCKKTESAVLAAKESGCDVLITEIDFGRKKGEGIELASRILEKCPFANVIFATSEPVRDYAPLIMRIKYSGYLTKPFAIEELEKEFNNLRHR